MKARCWYEIGQRMKSGDVGELVLLAALWGASFLFMRMGAAEFGPAPLAAVRCGIAAALLLGLLAVRGELAPLRENWRRVGAVGLTNSALPFLCFGIAALAIDAGLSAIFNAATPLWTAFIAALLWRERLAGLRWLGLIVGLSGVVWLAWDRAGLKAGAHGVSPALAIAACLLATALYGWSANVARRRLSHVHPLALAAGSQAGAALALAIPALLTWPATNPGATAWLATITLAVLCTALAYILYFRLIAHAGATNASAVTFLIPAFAVAWGWLFLDETINLTVAAACGVILVGTSLAMGLLPRRSA
jgi:drug/metabolite transporter (DMT)-like permease